MGVLGFLFVGVIIVFFLFFNQKEESQVVSIKDEKGDIIVKGKILYDPVGFIEIQAEDKNTASFLIGYTQARERLMQLEVLRLIVHGNLHLLSSKGKEIDIYSSFLNFKISNTLNGLSAEDAKLLESFVSGINYYKKNSKLDFGPLYYLLPSVSNELWEVKDIALLYRFLSFQLSTDFSHELNRYGLAKKYGFQIEENLRFPWYKEPFAQIYSDSESENFKRIGRKDKATILLKDQLIEQAFAFGYKDVAKRATVVIDKEGVVQFMQVLPSPGDLPDMDAIKAAVKKLG